jgi:hypothetical protein
VQREEKMEENAEGGIRKSKQGDEYDQNTLYACMELS